jgi:hypothetical protein
MFNRYYLLLFVGIFVERFFLQFIGIFVERFFLQFIGIFVDLNMKFRLYGSLSGLSHETKRHNANKWRAMVFEGIDG